MAATGPVPMPQQYTEQQAEAMRRTLKEIDTRLGAQRDELDGHARGRRYPKMITTATAIAKLAAEAQATAQALDAIQTWLNANQPKR